MRNRTDGSEPEQNASDRIGSHRTGERTGENVEAAECGERVGAGGVEQVDAEALGAHAVQHAVEVLDRRRVGYRVEVALLDVHRRLVDARGRRQTRRAVQDAGGRGRGGRRVGVRRALQEAAHDGALSDARAAQNEDPQAVGGRRVLRVIQKRRHRVGRPAGRVREREICEPL